MQLPPEVVALARAQRGVVSRRQLLGLGITKSCITLALGRTWRMALPGVVLLQTGPPTDEQRLIAAFLFVARTASLPARLPRD